MNELLESFGLSLTSAIALGAGFIMLVIAVILLVASKNKKHCRTNYNGIDFKKKLFSRYKTKKTGRKKKHGTKKWLPVQTCFFFSVGLFASCCT